MAKYLLLASRELSSTSLILLLFFSQIPHLRLHERAFVLRPLCDINPELVHPTMNRSMLDLLNSLPESDRSPFPNLDLIISLKTFFDATISFSVRVWHLVQGSVSSISSNWCLYYY